MSEALKTSSPTNLEHLLSVTFSRVLECGPTPCGKPDGLMTAKCGLAPAPANLSPRQAKELGLLTSGTFGRPGSISSRSEDLRLSLASKLMPPDTSPAVTPSALSPAENLPESERSSLRLSPVPSATKYNLFRICGAPTLQAAIPCAPTA